MKEYDTIVIGSGSAMNILQKAMAKGDRTALIDKGPAGGTCLNVGCIPSKMLTSVADRVLDIKESGKFGITSEISRIDFKKVMDYMRKHTRPDHENILQNLRSAKFDFYEGEAHFTDDYVLEIGGQLIKGKKIFIGSGSRPFIPEEFMGVNYLTNESVLKLDDLPESIIIVGGGFIGVEYAHFFQAMGSKVSLVQKNSLLVPDEEPEVSELLEQELRKRMDVYTGLKITEVAEKGGGCSLSGVSEREDKRFQCLGKRIMVAIGRESNADLLKVSNSGIDTGQNGYIKVDEYFETTKKNIYAFGDAIGKAMFTHAANKESALTWQNATERLKDSLDYEKVPHAVYSWPQIASVGLTEKQARTDHGNNISVGIVRYSDVAKGAALREEDGFAKAILYKRKKILGCHIIGPFAPILIQEIINAMHHNIEAEDFVRTMHIHPALTELVQKAVQKAIKENQGLKR